MAAIIHFHDDAERRFTWSGPKYLYETITNFIVENLMLSDSLRHEFDYYRHNFYVDFTKFDNQELDSFKELLVNMFNLIDRGEIAFNAQFRVRSLISLGHMIEISIFALHLRNHDAALHLTSEASQ